MQILADHGREEKYNLHRETIFSHHGQDTGQTSRVARTLGRHRRISCRLGRLGADIVHYRYLLGEYEHR